MPDRDPCERAIVPNDPECRREHGDNRGLVDYSQYYLTDADEDGQARGRLPAGPGGMLAVGPSLVVLYGGTHTGPVRVTVQVHQAAPPLELTGWEDVAEVSFTAPNGQVMLEEWGGQVHQELPNQHEQR